jgi:hypothetical protein
MKRLLSTGLDIISGISGHPEEVLDAYFSGNLNDPRFLMPGVKGDKLIPGAGAADSIKTGSGERKYKNEQEV